jgi:hypothetical protein
VRKIPHSASLLTFLDDLEYTEAALSADPEAADFALPFREEIEAWEPIFKKEREGRRKAVRAEALVAVRNAQLDTATTHFGASALAEAGGDRKHPAFRRFFPVAPSQFIRKPLRKQCEHTLNVMVPEIDKLDDQIQTSQNKLPPANTNTNTNTDTKNTLRAFAEPLARLAKDALLALDARTKAKAQKSAAASDVDEWKEGVNALRLTAHAELLKIAAEKGFSRSWVDSFFLSEPASQADNDDRTHRPGPSDARDARDPRDLDTGDA